MIALLASLAALIGAVALEAALPGPKTAPAEAGTLLLSGE